MRDSSCSATAKLEKLKSIYQKQVNEAVADVYTTKSPKQTSKTNANQWIELDNLGKQQY